MRSTRPHKSEFLPPHKFISQGDDWHYLREFGKINIPNACFPMRDSSTQRPQRDSTHILMPLEFRLNDIYIL